MKTSELIQHLQELDPEGNLDVVVGNEPIYFVEVLPAYYDGPKQQLIQDPSFKGYNVIGFKITDQGKKVKLHILGLESFLTDNPEVSVDLSELNSLSTRERYLKHIAKFKEEDSYIEELSKVQELGDPEE